MVASPPVSITTQVTGPATSTWANSVKTITDALNQPAAFIAYQSSTVTSIPTGSSVSTPIGWADSAGIVLDNQSAHSTATNPTRWTCPAGWAGWYWVEGTVYWTGASSGSRYVNLQVNGAGVPGAFSYWSTAPVSGNFTQAVGFRVFLNAGDYLELGARQTTGASLSTVVGTSVASSLTLEYRGAA